MKTAKYLQALACVAAVSWMTACEKKFDPASGAPTSTPAVVEASHNGTIAIPDAGRYSLVTAEAMQAYPRLNVTGSVFPDIAREVPVISLASGRVVDIRARLDDHVKKGDLLLRVQSPDITNAFDVYLKAANDEQLARTALNRAQDLYDHGAVPKSALEQAQDTEEDALTDLHAAEQQLKTLGVDKEHPSSIVNVYAPIPGVIVAQNVTDAAAAGVTYAGSPTAFTIADLSVVWIICDVYENDIPKLKLGQAAEIKLAAYPDETLTGRISDIGPILDPNIRTAKVRVEVPNPRNLLRLGMFVTASFQGQESKSFAVIPATAVLHLHDRDWVYEPAGSGQFRRVEVEIGDTEPDGKQQVLSGIAPGQQIVGDVLALETALEAQ
ncbi:efflux RND transporter periplasmic adaptor subunit [Silvibacterium dinghuense]|uniref:Efflux RND transporter periplasmic adaptor subunit n=1 Tax=Silvibacterium dinghuense TaxID=1560006 RepID=A0A4Q1S9K3_9BACT|nr:efflux RND transporter periplasmic adaptor subunit [Silvibacterium dinghuense]RXS93657.1 efflux RND transporter periplasmic adaptor subunit [Silvibacterium dinghuense]GGH06524.1 hypothetical protein GCM10011586_23360 [Silvibacterium dinghuense]